MENQEAADIKIISPSTCPHCSKTIVLALKYKAPEITEAFRVEDISRAKNDARDKLKEISDLPENIRQQAIEYVMAEETIFAPSDVDEIIDNIKKQYGIA